RHAGRGGAEPDPATAGGERAAPRPAGQARCRHPAHFHTARRQPPAAARGRRRYRPGQHALAPAHAVRRRSTTGTHPADRRRHARRSAPAVRRARRMSTPRLRTVLVDDEVLARLALRQALASHPEVDIVGECGNAAEAMQAVRALRPDLLFLDIQTPGTDGFELLHELSPDRLPLVVFATAFADHALRAFDAMALDYVLK